MELTESEIAAVLRNYAIGEFQSLSKISRGYINYNWLIKTRTGSYVLRAAPTYRTKKELSFEHLFLLALEGKFPYGIPLPIETVSNTTLCNFKGHLFWLYKYIPGEVIKQTTNQQVKQVAQMMASMHTASENMKIKDSKKWPHALNKRSLLLDLTVLQQRLRRKHTITANYFKEHLAEIKDCILAVDPHGYSDLKRFPIHADVYNPNLVFANNKLVAVIDFDNCHVDTAIHDIGCYLHSSCRKGYKLDLEKAKMFLKEYRKLRPISRQEVRYLADIAIMGYAGSFYFYSQASETGSKEAKLLAMLKRSKLATVWCAQNRTQIHAALV